jgi:hypothetical protein
MDLVMIWVATEAKKLYHLRDLQVIAQEGLSFMDLN